MKFKDVLDAAIKEKASDLFVKAGSALRGRVGLDVKTVGDYVFTEGDVEEIAGEVLDDAKREFLGKNKNYDFGVNYGDRWRFRVAIFYQRSALAMVIRKIGLEIPSFEELNLPRQAMERFAGERQGLILLTGVTGSGKSTTIASLINFINANLGRHVLTVEEPIEFTFRDGKSIINQRELGADVSSYPDALSQFTLHSPDVI